MHPSYFVQLLFSIQRSGSYSGKIRDGKNKVLPQLPIHSLLYHFLIAIPFLLLADKSSVQFHNSTEHLNMPVSSFSEKSLMEKLSSNHRVITKWKRLCQSAVIPSSTPKELFLGNKHKCRIKVATIFHSSLLASRMLFVTGSSRLGIQIMRRL